MTVERHLLLQSLTLRPSGEWTPDKAGWTVVRVAEGAGYFLQSGSEASQLNTSDAVITSPNTGTIVRASQLGELKLEFFLVLPQYLNGLLTVAECQQLEQISSQAQPRVLQFAASEPTAQKFMRLAAQPQPDSLSARSALLQLWAGAITGLLPAADTVVAGNKLRERLRQFVGQMSEAQLATRPLPELAEELHCSERHFSRLFRLEFGVAFRSRQTELRLNRARQLLMNPDAKIISVAYESGYRHLGLFNAMFKKRFGITPSECRRQGVPPPGKNLSKRTGAALWLLLALAGILFARAASAQPADTDAQAKARAALLQKMAEVVVQESRAHIHVVPVSTNGPHFPVDKYLLVGNSILKPGDIGGIFTNVPAAFGTNVSLEAIRAALGDLQMAYRERGFVTVSVSLPPQKLTNAEVRVNVTEGRLAAINVTGNKYFSTENVLRALPSLHTNMLLNSHVFQRELDTANASRDRQIYPVIGPGLEPGSSEITLKVQDRFPAHARVEFNNLSTPGTPENRVNFNSQYDNLWGLEHQVGLQYSFTPLDYATLKNFYFSPLDLPLIANYSAYYRIPLGSPVSVQEQIDANPGRFGFNEVTHQFQMPPPTGRPELTIFASRSVSDSGIQRGPSGNLFQTASQTTPGGVVYIPATITTNSAGQNVTLNEDIGLKFSMPLPQIGNFSSTLSLGADFKRYRQVSYNTNENFFILQQPDSSVPGGIATTISPSPQPILPPGETGVDYFPLNVGLSGSMPDSLGTTYFNSQANFNVLPYFSGDKDFAAAAHSARVRANYVTLQLGADRVQSLYKDWTVKLHADGQWADGPLLSNEQFAMGGSGGVRGYLDGEAYGDTGWRMSIEPQTPLVNIGMVDGDVPFWLRSSVFMDYGEIYSLAQPGTSVRLQYWGAGFGITANIGNHLDARLTVAFPLLTTALTSAGDVHVYFGVGGQF
jgi:hemolysin activation/secretion protein/AraC-like DNA-binding protein